MTSASALLDSPFRQAERTLRRPSSAVWLRAVRLHTSRFDDALAFYVTALGLTLGGVDVHQVTAATSARLLDAEGAAVFELHDDPDATAGAHELAFAVPRRTVTLLRARLTSAGIPATECGSALAFSDPDGNRIRVEAIG